MVNSGVGVASWRLPKSRASRFFQFAHALPGARRSCLRPPPPSATPNWVTKETTVGECVPDT